MVVILTNLPSSPQYVWVGGTARITTMHHCMAKTGRILDMVGPYRVSGEPAVLYFNRFHIDGVKMWHTMSIYPYKPCAGAVMALAAMCQCPPVVTI